MIENFKHRTKQSFYCLSIAYHLEMENLQPVSNLSHFYFDIPKNIHSFAARLLMISKLLHIFLFIKVI